MDTWWSQEDANPRRQQWKERWRNRDGLGESWSVLHQRQPKGPFTLGGFRNAPDLFGSDFPTGNRSPDVLVTNQHFCFDCSHAADAQAYVDQWLRRLDKNRSGSVYWLCLNCAVVWLNIITFSTDRISYANVRKLHLWNCDIFEKSMMIATNRAQVCGILRHYSVSQCGVACTQTHLAPSLPSLSSSSSCKITNNNNRYRVPSEKSITHLVFPPLSRLV